MKKLFYLPLLIMLLGCLIAGFLSLGQPSTVYAAPDYEYKRPTNFSEADVDDWSSEDQAYNVVSDNDTSTYATSAANPGSTTAWITFDTWETKGQTYTYTATDLFVNWAADAGYDNDQFDIQYTKDGSTWLDLLPMGVYDDTGIVTTSIALDADQDLTLVNIRLNYAKVTSGDTGITYIYDIWTRGTYTPPVTPVISNTPDTWDVNSPNPVEVNTTYLTGLTHFTLTNSSGYAINVSISGEDMTGTGETWTLSNDGSNSVAGTYGLMAGLSLTSYDIVVKRDAAYNNLVTNMPQSSTQDWGLQLLTPTSFGDGTLKSGDVTLTATAY